jgi:cytochrome c biogenesis protein CcmG, thiol:disulfide interchange protein DsbE
MRGLARVGARPRRAWLAAALLLLAACAPERAPRVGDAVPAELGRALDGRALRLDALRGEVVVVNVWATWCEPCRREMPALQELHRQLGREGFRVVGVSVDGAGAAGAIRAFLDEHDIDFDVVHDPRQRVPRAYGTMGVPETFLVGRDGRLVHHWRGRIDARSPMVRSRIYAALDAR